jgi:spermidine/putrescine-binding protein
MLLMRVGGPTTVALAAGTLVLAVVACGDADGDDLSSDELELYTWTEYVPESVISGFEERHDVTVNVTYYDSNEEAIAGIEANPGTYDLVIPSDYAVEILIARGLLEDIDVTSDIKHFGNIEESFQAPFFDPGTALRTERGREGEPKHTVPYQWGTTGIVYDPNQIPFTPAEWDDVADADVRGRVALINDARDVLGAGLIANGHDKNDSSPEALADAQGWVESLDAVPVNVDNPEQPLIDGEAVIGIMYNGSAAEAMRANPELRYVLPEDGSIWFDSLAIPEGAPHRDAALAFIDYVLEPEVGAEITRTFGYSTPNDAALDVLEDENDPAVDNVATNPPQDALLDLLLTKDAGPEGNARFEQAWEEVRP